MKNRPPQFLAEFAVCVLAAALFAIPADEARTHTDNSAAHHTETDPLYEVARAGDLNSVNHFLDAHMADVHATEDGYGNTPLLKATEQGALPIIITLLAAGANC